jgi:hypothetical protein
MTDDGASSHRHGLPREDAFPTIHDFLAQPADDELVPYCGTIQAAVVPRGDINFYHGPPKSNKTWTIASLALSIASGQPWLGVFPVRRSRVLYLQADGPRFKWRERITKLMRGMGLAESDLDGWFVTDMRAGRSLAVKSHIDGMIEALGDWHPQVAFFDPLAKFIAGDLDENSNHDMGVLVSRLELAQAAWEDCTVGISQHETKNSTQEGGGRMRGATTLWASGNTCRFRPLSRSRSEFDLSLKDYDGPEPFVVGVEVGTEIATVSYLGPALTAARRENEAKIIQSLSASGEWMTFRDIEEATGIPGSTVRDSIKTLLESGDAIEGDTIQVGRSTARTFTVPTTDY